jgi:hypothetical protein
METESVLCPSSRCQDGALLIGIVLPNGRVAITSERIVIDEEFVRIASEGRSPEKRFRFAGTCIKSGCRQWSESRCQVVDEALELADVGVEAYSLPDCSIRRQCRWFLQSGANACRVCPEVITDRRIELEDPVPL